eukprot:364602-Chlamydomonas_euryale.AAC.8
MDLRGDHADFSTAAAFYAADQVLPSTDFADSKNMESVLVPCVGSKAMTSNASTRKSKFKRKIMRGSALSASPSYARTTPRSSETVPADLHA